MGAEALRKFPRFPYFHLRNSSSWPGGGGIGNKAVRWRNEQLEIRKSTRVFIFLLTDRIRCPIIPELLNCYAIARNWPEHTLYKHYVCLFHLGQLLHRSSCTVSRVCIYLCIPLQAGKRIVHLTITELCRLKMKHSAWKNKSTTPVEKNISLMRYK